MVTTRSRPRGRETALPNTGGPVAEHLRKIYGIAIAGVIIVIAFLTLTSIGHVIDLAVQNYMLMYAGVFALITLCASVGAGLVSTDRIFLHPGHRVLMQSIHRAISFGALAFVVIHVVTEILAQRIHVIDAFIPFLQPFKTFYIGLGTISFDLILLLVVTGILRKRFTGNAKNVWMWRAIHYSSYLAFVFGVWHGLLGGRAGKPYVDWSYGFVVAFVALGLAVRILSNSLRPKEALSSAPVAESAASGSAPLRAATMYAQLSDARLAGTSRMAMSGSTAAMLPAGGRTGTAAMPAVTAAGLPSAAGYPQETMAQGPTALAAPVYEPGYDGPPRYAGTPRSSGPMPQAPGGQTGPRRRPIAGPSPISGPMPQAPMTRPRPQLPGGPVPGGPAQQYPGSGPVPQAPGGWSGPRRRPMAGPGPISGPMPQAPMAGPGPISGPMPQVPGGQSRPRQRPMAGPGPASGPMRRAGTGPTPQMPGGPGQQYPASGSMPMSGRGTPHRGGPQYDAPQYGGQEYAGPRQGGAGATGQDPWENSFPETDPNLRYRAPGPGMPGYRAPGDR